ncbi:MAG: glucose-6-phosphate isomerase [Clostridia bacterium]|nr:glucose-6-phosphate isomerase [Clostridia bacterium]
MSIKLNEKFTKGFVSECDIKAITPEIEKALETVKSGTGEGSDFLGWLTRPEDYDREEYARVKAAAEKIRNTCDVFIVIGIGGSYLGARSAIEFVKGNKYNTLRGDAPEIYFSGNDISATSVAELLEICEGKDVCINVVSKSGTTTEPAVAFRIFRGLLEKKYGVEGARERIFVTTDKCRGKLKEFSDKNGYETFVVPDDIGGRYSVLTPVGLLPIAVAGIDTDAMLKGAADAMKTYGAADIASNSCLRYAAIRNILYRGGKTMEILAAYEPSMQMFCEWWKQLYGESEGKDTKGIFPASVIFSTDLHSLGQYIQQGLRNLFETVIDIKNSNDKIAVPDDPENVDGLNFLSGKELNEINHSAMTATLYAHFDGGVPNMVLEIPDRSAYTYGELVYFFELACGVSGYTLGVNPFNQPGVEAYKKNMFALLGKPDPSLDELKAKLAERMSEK